MARHDGFHGSPFPVEMTAMENAISSLEKNEGWRKTLLICDCKSLVDAFGDWHALDEGKRLVQAALTRLNAERCLEVLWVPGYCGRMANELAHEEAKFGSVEQQPPVALDPATRRVLIRRACASNFSSTSSPYS